jgi:hypothetical protein
VSTARNALSSRFVEVFGHGPEYWSDVEDESVLADVLENGELVCRPRSELLRIIAEHGRASVLAKLHKTAHARAVRIRAAPRRIRCRRRARKLARIARAGPEDGPPPGDDDRRRAP